jgi:hypothetical protein
LPGWSISTLLWSDHLAKHAECGHQIDQTPIETSQIFIDPAASEDNLKEDLEYNLADDSGDDLESFDGADFAGIDEQTDDAEMGLVDEGYDGVEALRSAISHIYSSEKSLKEKNRQIERGMNPWWMMLKLSLKLSDE